MSVNGDSANLVPASAGERRHVVVRLQGGLGNQLFQLAAGLKISRQLDASLSFTNSSSANALTAFLGSPIPHTTSPLEMRSGLGPHRHMRLLWEARRRLLPGRGILLRQTATEAYDTFAHIGELDGATYVGMNGYFQHPSWYASEEHRVLSALYHRLQTATELAQPSEFTVIALRRGDYVRLGWALTESYYRRAITALELSHRKVYVVADDPMMVTVVAGWLGRSDDDVRPPQVEVDDLTRDLALLAGAGQVIMANSTFHWWGVAAGDTQHQRRIIAPATWIGQEERSKVLLRPYWEMISD